MDVIDYFEFVRDIPYKIGTVVGEPDYSCSGKHKILYRLFQSVGVKARYRVCEFLWTDIKLPKRVKKVRHENLSTHTYLEVHDRKKGVWVTVDATWDKGLSKVFSVNEWDGKSDTSLAVKPKKIYSPKQSKKLVEGESIEDVRKDLEAHGNFYKAVNEWLERIRTS